jgi:hypothetical protein
MSHSLAATHLGSLDAVAESEDAMDTSLNGPGAGQAAAGGGTAGYGYVEAPTEVEFILNPNRWPRWPLLPVVKMGDRTPGVIAEYGLNAGANGTPLLFFHEGQNVLTFDTKAPGIRLERPDVEQLVSDGWVVD